jgi:hypothetical protein
MIQGVEEGRFFCGWWRTLPQEKVTSQILNNE